MENTMRDSKKFKIGVLLPILVLVGLFAAFYALSTLYPSTPQRQVPAPPIYDFEFFYVAHSIVSTINIALLVVLLISFISIYRKTKSEFSFGLTVFGFAFLLKDIFASPFVVSAFSFYVSGLGPFAVLPDLFEFSALIVLLYLSIKY